MEIGLDPNAEDHCRETPLHYAAFAGHSACVKMLLRYGANASAESSYTETALFVARANVAAFLDVDTTMVCKLLEVWETAELELLGEAAARGEGPCAQAEGAYCLTDSD